MSKTACGQAGPLRALATLIAAATALAGCGSRPPVPVPVGEAGVVQDAGALLDGADLGADTAAYAVDGACDSCGGRDQPCCGGHACTAAGTGCLRGICRDCGVGEGSPCCADNSCGPGDLVCHQTFIGNFCRPCGGPEQPCCAGERCSGGGCCYHTVCLAAGSACGPPDSGEGLCRDGRCAGCGGRNQACCGKDRRCHEPGTVCASTAAGPWTCLACGGAGQPCCKGQDGALPTCLAGLLCSDAICERCGGPGQRCCEGDACAGGACCWQGQCVAGGQLCAGTGRCRDGNCECGQSGQGCCPQAPGQSPSSCTDARSLCRLVGEQLLCVPCGVPGTPCCANRRCDAGCCAEGCVAAGEVCPGGGACTPTGACGSCGGPGQPCCATGPRLWCSAPATTCWPDPARDSYICESCGGAGQRCCTPSVIRGASTSGGSCTPPLACGGTTCRAPPEQRCRP